jgi:hypothetical protein
MAIRDYFLNWHPVGAWVTEEGGGDACVAFVPISLSCLFTIIGLQIRCFCFPTALPLPTLGRRKRPHPIGYCSFATPHLGRRKRPHPTSTPLPPLRDYETIACWLL